LRLLHAEWLTHYLFRGLTLDARMPAAVLLLFLSTESPDNIQNGGKWSIPLGCILTFVDAFLLSAQKVLAGP